MKKYLLISLIPSISFATNFVPLSGSEFNNVFISSQSPAGGSINALFNSAYSWGVGIAIILAVIFIMYGGFLYLTSDVFSNKSAGKEAVKNAFLGLLIVLGSYAILFTINPEILKSTLDLSRLSQPISNPGGPGGANPGVPGQPGGGNPPGGSANDWLQNNDLAAFSNSSASQAILGAAQYAADNTLDTCSVPGTNGGRRACAYAVNTIVGKATGSPINNSLATATMYQNLKNSNRFVYVGNNLGSSQPGDIVISPTNGSRTGHVGIVETAGATSIISNSSSNAEVRRNYTRTSWESRYNNQLGLGTYVFRAR